MIKNIDVGNLYKIENKDIDLLLFVFDITKGRNPVFCFGCEDEQEGYWIEYFDMVSCLEGERFFSRKELLNSKVYCYSVNDLPTELKNMKDIFKCYQRDYRKVVEKVKENKEIRAELNQQITDLNFKYRKQKSKLVSLCEKVLDLNRQLKWVECLEDEDTEMNSIQIIENDIDTALKELYQVSEEILKLQGQMNKIEIDKESLSNFIEFRSLKNVFVRVISTPKYFSAADFKILLKYCEKGKVIWEVEKN